MKILLHHFSEKPWTLNHQAHHVMKNNASIKIIRKETYRLYRSIIGLKLDLIATQGLNGLTHTQDELSEITAYLNTVTYLDRMLWDVLDNEGNKRLGVVESNF